MNRRDLLHHGAAAAFFGVVKSMPDAALLKSDPEAYWKKIREDQFFLPDWRVYLNTGSLGVPPRCVVKTVSDGMERAAGRIDDDYPRWGYETLDSERAVLAEFFGCKRDELAITHNATDALSMIAAGLDLRAGDEVLMTDQEHVSGKSPWQRRAQRDGITTREVPLPLPPKSPEQLIDLMVSAIGPRTRVLMISGIVTTTGLIMPAHEICTAARAKGVITVVDGAHMNGQIPFRISDLNCDYFAGSPHKWLFAPPGCGILYIREENLDRLWPTITTGDWDNKSLKAARFMKVGTNNKSIMMGMMAGLQFLKDIGPQVVYDRIHHLARLNRRMAAERKYARLLTPDDDRMYGSLVTVEFPEKDYAPMWKKFKERHIWTLMGPRVRIATHIHTRPSDLELLYKTTDEVFG